MTKLKKYRVTIEETVIYDVEVEAEDRRGAETVAVDRLIDADNNRYFTAVTERDVTRVKELK
jgi:hypothetical protein